MKKYVLSIENFLKLEKIDLPLEPGVVGIVGQNAQGKTSIITALQDLMSGTNDFTKVREGAERAVVKLDVYDDEGLVTSVQRTQTPKTNSLTAKGLRAGHTATSYLQSVLSDMAVNPILLTAGPVDYLKKHVKVEWQVSDFPAEAQNILQKNAAEYQGLSAFVVAEHVSKELEGERLLKRKELEVANARLPDLASGLPLERPEAPADTAEAIQAERGALQAQRTQIAVLQERKQQAENAAARTHQGYTKARQEIDRLQAKMADFMKQYESAKSQADILDAQSGQAFDLHQQQKAEAEAIAVPTTTELDGQEAALNMRRVALESHAGIITRLDLLEKRRAEAVQLTEKFSAFDSMVKTVKYDLPKKFIERCDLGVEGLEIRDGELYCDGHHISRMSTAEKAITTTKIALSLAKKRGHIAVCLDGVESLDAEHRKEFLAAAEASGVCVIYTKVSDAPADKHERLMHDGKLAEATT